LWANNFPELETAEIQNLAARYRLAGGDVRTVSSLVRAQARLDGDNSRAGVRDHLPAACSVVTRRSTSHFAVPIVPKRGPSDLILPDSLHRQVLEVAKFFQMQSRVDEDWGFARLAGCSGMRALFTGEPGTGKTLSAEVIAGMLGLTLYKVDLARVISKWVRLMGVEYTRETFAQTLLPVWRLDYTYFGFPYRIVINGANGTAVGKAPVSAVKIALVAIVALWLFVLVQDPPAALAIPAWIARAVTWLVTRPFAGP